MFTTIHLSRDIISKMTFCMKATTTLRNLQVIRTPFISGFFADYGLPDFRLLNVCRALTV